MAEETLPDPNSSPDFTDKVTGPETNLKGIRCSRILANRMQCPRKAERRKPEDITGREAVCFVCWSIEGEDPEYSEIL